jgi:hypothetical protein
MKAMRESVESVGSVESVEPVESLHHQLYGTVGLPRGRRLLATWRSFAAVFGGNFEAAAR